jgi:hypothetical protein
MERRSKDDPSTFWTDQSIAQTRYRQQSPEHRTAGSKEMAAGTGSALAARFARNHTLSGADRPLIFLDCKFNPLPQVLVRRIDRD